MGNDIYCPTRLPFPTQSRSRFLGFHPIWRRRVARLATQATPIADLADSFPALLFALASGYGTRLQRKRARAHIEMGHSLKAAAKALDLPFWLRRIPASAFTRPLPAIPGDMDYGSVRGLSREAQQKLAQVRPQTVGQAARIQGITPAAISLLLVHLKRRSADMEKSA